MSTPGEAAPFQRLRHVLTRDSLGDSQRVAARQTMSPEFERVALSPGWPARDRLAALADLAAAAQVSCLPPREREIVIIELSRLALRILWWEGLLGPGIAPEAAPVDAAVMLIEICATGLLPEGPAGWMALERAKALIMRADVVAALREDAPRRERLLVQLVQAEARLHPILLEKQTGPSSPPRCRRQFR